MMTLESAIRVVQLNERGRQGRQRAKFMKDIRSQEERERRLREQGDDERQPDLAAMHMQRCYRGFISRKKTNKMCVAIPPNPLYALRYWCSVLLESTCHYPHLHVHPHPNLSLSLLSSILLLSVSHLPSLPPYCPPRPQAFCAPSTTPFLHRRRAEELVFIGMAPPPAKEKEEDPLVKEAAVMKRRKLIQAQHEDEYRQALVALDKEVYDTEGPDMKEEMMDQLRDWCLAPPLMLCRPAPSPHAPAS